MALTSSYSCALAAVSGHDDRTEKIPRSDHQPRVDEPPILILLLNAPPVPLLLLPLLLQHLQIVEDLVLHAQLPRVRHGFRHGDVHTFKLHDDGHDVDERFRFAAFEPLPLHLVRGEVVDDGYLIAYVVEDALHGRTILVHARADGELCTHEYETGFGWVSKASEEHGEGKRSRGRGRAFVLLTLLQRPPSDSLGSRARYRMPPGVGQDGSRNQSGSGGLLRRRCPVPRRRRVDLVVLH